MKNVATVQSRMRFVKKSTFCFTSNRRAGPIEELTKTKMLDASGFHVTSEDTSSILCEDQLDNHVLQLSRIVDFFAVLIGVEDEWVYFPLKSLSHIHHSVF